MLKDNPKNIKQLEEYIDSIFTYNQINKKFFKNGIYKDPPPNY